MRILSCLCSVILFTNSAFSQERGLRLNTTDPLSTSMKTLILVNAGDPGPGAAKHKAIAVISNGKETLKVPGDGPYDLWWQGKTGIAVRALAGLKFKEGESKEFKPSQHLGTVNYRGENQPRAALITLAAQDDPGPDEKGHVPVQTSRDYREDMHLPEGFYSLWVSPNNGARPRKVIDRLRVQAGKNVLLD